VVFDAYPQVELRLLFFIPSGDCSNSPGPTRGKKYTPQKTTPSSASVPEARECCEDRGKGREFD